MEQNVYKQMKCASKKYGTETRIEEEEEEDEHKKEKNKCELYFQIHQLHGFQFKYECSTKSFNISKIYFHPKQIDRVVCAILTYFG